jgi:Rrf2 family iron-sulfur cluster assembly transcriptional regulator
MLVSTRGRYALRVLVDLAENSDGGFIPMKEIAARQGVSLKYMTKIMKMLTEGGIVEGVHGKGGGYRLAVKPDECTAGEVLRLTEGSIAPVACLGEDAKECERRDSCSTIGMWSELNDVISSYLDGVTIADLMKGGRFSR